MCHPLRVTVNERGGCGGGLQRIALLQDHWRHTDYVDGTWCPHHTPLPPPTTPPRPPLFQPSTRPPPMLAATPRHPHTARRSNMSEYTWQSNVVHTYEIAARVGRHRQRV